MWLVLLACGLGPAAACSELRTAAKCFPCRSECPGALQCDRELKLCVAPGERQACIDAIQTVSGGTTSGLSNPTNSGAGGDPNVSATEGSSLSTTDAGGDPGFSAVGGSVSSTTDTGGLGGGGGAEDVATSTSTGSAGAPADTGCDLGCTPEIRTTRKLQGVCQDTELYVEFEGGCACDPEGASRLLRWSGAEGTGLTLTSATGVLSGTLGPGSYEFDVRITIDDSLQYQDSFALEVWEHCNAFLLSDADGGGAQVLAARLDTGATQPVPRMLGDTSAVAQFDISPDGTYLAQVEVLEEDQKLQLFRVTSSDITPLGVEHSGNYLKHAFSRDGRWLTILTSNPADQVTSLLQLVDLSTTPAALLDSKPIEHVAGLAWSDVGGILYLAPVEGVPAFDSVREQWVEADGFGGETIYPGTEAYLDPLLQFLVNAAGFFTVRQIQAYYREREEDSIRQLTYPDWLSPGLWWVAVKSDEGVRIDPVDEDQLPDNPYAKAVGCDFISAWSGDDSTFVCMQDSEPVVYPTGFGGELEDVPISLPDGFRGPTERMALSERGNWFAFVPSDEGLVVLAAEDYETAVVDGATLSAPSGTNEWDFFFTRNEQQLIVQRGRELRVATLGPEPLEFTLVELEPGLKGVPECLPTWELDPERWCGAPHFSGNLLINAQETHLLFVDNENQARVVELATLQPLPLGQVSSSCTTDCIQFQ